MAPTSFLYGEMSSSVQNIESASQTEILGWMDELRQAVHATAWAELLDFDGVDALDVLLSPIYLCVLNRLREGPPRHKPTMRAALDRARYWAYQVKVALRERAAARKSAPPAPADVLLWPRDITHIVTLHPVAQALRQQGVSCGMIACQVTTFHGLHQRDPAAVFAGAAWPGVVRQARRRGFQRARRLARVGPWKVPPFPRGTAVDLEPAVRQTVIDFLPLVSEAVANAHAALDVFGSKSLVVGNDVTLEGRAACRVAVQRGLPTAVFMHGNISSDALQSMHCADRVLVYGEIHRQELIRHKLSPQRIVVCGAPSLDQRRRQSGRVHPLLKARLGLRDGDPWILAATSGPGHRISHAHHAQVVQALSRLSLAMPQVPLVVKLHRKDRLEYYAQALNHDTASRLTVVATEAAGFPHDIFEWLEGCPVLLTGASTVAVEAMLMDVPVVTMDFCDEIHEVDFIDAGATAHVRTSEGLVDVVRATLAARGPSPDVQAHVQAYLSQAFCALDGCSAARGVHAILQLIDDEGSGR